MRGERKATVFKFWLMVLVVFGLDQGSKVMVQRSLEPGLSVEVVGQILRFTYIYNPGGAFGILGEYRLLLLAASLLAVVVLVAALPWILREGYIWPAGLLLGGALGNLADRLRYGKVVDFIDLGFWPVFNIADIAIGFGVALMALHILWQKQDQEGAEGGHA